MTVKEIMTFTSGFACILSTLFAELTEVLRPQEQNIEFIVAALIGCIQGGHAVFVTGSGISGAIAKMLVFRLKQLGVEAYHIPEGVARSYRPGDVLFAISSSGTTKTTLTQVKQAKRVEGVMIISIVSE
ncbi:MAG: SIS domain-containing protein, partial [bacterium]|nr:SIS domain-containing protein [bacterium]